MATGSSVQFSSVQFSSVLSCVQLFAIPWISARQTSLPITNSQRLLKLMSTESVMPSDHLILCRPFPSHLQFALASGSFQMSQLFASRGQCTGVSASTSLLPMSIQDWFPLGLIGSPCSPRDSQVFSNSTVQKHQFFCAQLSLWSNSHIHTWPMEKL